MFLLLESVLFWPSTPAMGGPWPSAWARRVLAASGCSIASNECGEDGGAWGRTTALAALTGTGPGVSGDWRRRALPQASGPKSLFSRAYATTGPSEAVSGYLGAQFAVVQASQAVVQVTGCRPPRCCRLGIPWGFLPCRSWCTSGWWSGCRRGRCPNHRRIGATSCARSQRRRNWCWRSR